VVHEIEVVAVLTACEIALQDLIGNAVVGLVDAGIAEAAGSERDALGPRGILDGLEGNGLALRSEEVEGNGAPALLVAVGTEEAHQGLAVGMAQARHATEQVEGESVDPVLDPLHADAFEETQAFGDGGDIEVVHGAVLEALVVIVQEPIRSPDGGQGDVAPGVPPLGELVKGVLADEQGPQPGRVAEHLVEGHRDELRLDLLQVER